MTSLMRRDKDTTFPITVRFIGADVIVFYYFKLFMISTLMTLIHVFAQQEVEGTFASNVFHTLNKCVAKVVPVLSIVF